MDEGISSAEETKTDMIDCRSIRLEDETNLRDPDLWFY